MKVQNHQIYTNSSYFNLEFEQTTASISNTSNMSNTLSSDKSKAALEIQDSNRLSDNNNWLSKELSGAILKNISSERRRLVGDRVEISQTYVEAQALSFSTKALVKTEDKEIEVSLDVSLSRSFVQQMDIRVESFGAFKDPLILSLDGTMPTLSSKTFEFDIDSDGEKDQISQLSKNSAFLALDKNSNGRIDDGSELFGTKSGDGFGDLSKYDDDKNGWIDENDKIFDSLRVWQKSENENRLVGLGEVGIGAIFLGDTVTPFTLKSESNATLGQIRSSAFFLFEDGHAGTISQVDFAVNKKTDEKLNMLDDITKNLSKLKLDNLYTNSEDNTDTLYEKMQKLHKKLLVLENKLLSASDDERASIQAKIAVINTQILSLLNL